MESTEERLTTPRGGEEEEEILQEEMNVQEEEPRHEKVESSDMAVEVSVDNSSSGENKESSLIVAVTDGDDMLFSKNQYSSLQSQQQQHSLCVFPETSATEDFCGDKREDKPERRETTRPPAMGETTPPLVVVTKSNLDEEDERKSDKELMEGLAMCQPNHQEKQRKDDTEDREDKEEEEDASKSQESPVLEEEDEKKNQHQQSTCGAAVQMPDASNKDESNKGCSSYALLSLEDETQEDGPTRHEGVVAAIAADARGLQKTVTAAKPSIQQPPEVDNGEISSDSVAVLDQEQEEETNQLKQQRTSTAEQLQDSDINDESQNNGCNNYLFPDKDTEDDDPKQKDEEEALAVFQDEKGSQKDEQQAHTILQSPKVEDGEMLSGSIAAVLDMDQNEKDQQEQQMCSAAVRMQDNHDEANEYFPSEEDTTVVGLGKDEQEEILAKVDTGRTQERAAVVKALSSQSSKDQFPEDAEDEDAKQEDEEFVRVQDGKGSQEDEQAQTLLQSAEVEDGKMLSGSIAVLDKDQNEEDQQEQQICSAVQKQDTDNHDEANKDSEHSPREDTTVDGLGQDEAEDVLAIVDTGRTQERTAALSSQSSEDLFPKDAEDDSSKQEVEVVLAVPAEKGSQKEEQAQTLLQSPEVEDGEMLSVSTAVLGKDQNEEDQQEQQICSVVRVQDNHNHDDEPANKDSEYSPSDQDILVDGLGQDDDEEVMAIVDTTETQETPEAVEALSSQSSEDLFPDDMEHDDPKQEDEVAVAVWDGKGSQTKEQAETLFQSRDVEEGEMLSGSIAVLDKEEEQQEQQICSAVQTEETDNHEEANIDSEYSPREDSTVDCLGQDEEKGVLVIVDTGRTHERALSSQSSEDLFPEDAEDDDPKQADGEIVAVQDEKGSQNEEQAQTLLQSAEVEDGEMLSGSITVLDMDKNVEDPQEQHICSAVQMKDSDNLAEANQDSEHSRTKDTTVDGLCQDEGEEVVAIVDPGRMQGRAAAVEAALSSQSSKDLFPKDAVDDDCKQEDEEVVVVQDEKGSQNEEQAQTLLQSAEVEDGEMLSGSIAVLNMDENPQEQHICSAVQMKDSDNHAEANQDSEHSRTKDTTVDGLCQDEGEEVVAIVDPGRMQGRAAAVEAALSSQSSKDLFPKDAEGDDCKQEDEEVVAVQDKEGSQNEEQAQVLLRSPVVEDDEMVSGSIGAALAKDRNEEEQQEQQICSCSALRMQHSDHHDEAPGEDTTVDGLGQDEEIEDAVIVDTGRTQETAAAVEVLSSESSEDLLPKDAKDYDSKQLDEGVVAVPDEKESQKEEQTQTLLGSPQGEDGEILSGSIVAVLEKDKNEKEHQEQQRCSAVEMEDTDNHNEAGNQDSEYSSRDEDITVDGLGQGEEVEVLASMDTGRTQEMAAAVEVLSSESSEDLFPKNAKDYDSKQQDEEVVAVPDEKQLQKEEQVQTLLGLPQGEDGEILTGSIAAVLHKDKNEEDQQEHQRCSAVEKQDTDNHDEAANQDSEYSPREEDITVDCLGQDKEVEVVAIVYTGSTQEMAAAVEVLSPESSEDFPPRDTEDDDPKQQGEELVAVPDEKESQKEEQAQTLLQSPDVVEDTEMVSGNIAAVLDKYENEEDQQEQQMCSAVDVQDTDNHEAANQDSEYSPREEDITVDGLGQDEEVEVLAIVDTGRTQERAAAVEVLSSESSEDFFAKDTKDDDPKQQSEEVLVVPDGKESQKEEQAQTLLQSPDVAEDNEMLSGNIAAVLDKDNEEDQEEQQEQEVCSAVEMQDTDNHDESANQDSEYSPREEDITVDGLGQDEEVEVLAIVDTGRTQERAAAVEVLSSAQSSEAFLAKDTEDDDAKQQGEEVLVVPDGKESQKEEQEQTLLQSPDVAEDSEMLSGNIAAVLDKDNEEDQQEQQQQQMCSAVEMQDTDNHDESANQDSEYSPREEDITVDGLGQDEEVEVLAIVETGRTQERAAGVEVLSSAQSSEDFFAKETEDDDPKQQGEEVVAVSDENESQKEKQAQTLSQSPDVVEDTEMVSGNVAAVLDKDENEEDQQEQQMCSAVEMQDTDNHDEAANQDSEYSPSEKDITVDCLGQDKEVEVVAIVDTGRTQERPAVVEVLSSGSSEGFFAKETEGDYSKQEGEEVVAVPDENESQKEEQAQTLSQSPDVVEDTEMVSGNVSAVLDKDENEEDQQEQQMCSAVEMQDTDNHDEAANQDSEYSPREKDITVDGLGQNEEVEVLDIVDTGRMQERAAAVEVLSSAQPSEDFFAKDTEDDDPKQQGEEVVAVPDENESQKEEQAQTLSQSPDVVEDTEMVSGNVAAVLDKDENEEDQQEQQMCSAVEMQDTDNHDEAANQDSEYSPSEKDITVDCLGQDKEVEVVAIVDTGRTQERPAVVEVLSSGSSEDFFAKDTEGDYSKQEGEEVVPVPDEEESQKEEQAQTLLQSPDVVEDGKILSRSIAAVWDKDKNEEDQQDQRMCSAVEMQDTDNHDEAANQDSEYSPSKQDITVDGLGHDKEVEVLAIVDTGRTQEMAAAVEVTSSQSSEDMFLKDTEDNDPKQQGEEVLAVPDEKESQKEEQQAQMLVISPDMKVDVIVSDSIAALLDKDRNEVDQQEQQMCSTVRMQNTDNHDDDAANNKDSEYSPSEEDTMMEGLGQDDEEEVLVIVDTRRTQERAVAVEVALSSQTSEELSPEDAEDDDSKQEVEVVLAVQDEKESQKEEQAQTLLQSPEVEDGELLSGSIGAVMEMAQNEDDRQEQQACGAVRMHDTENQDEATKDCKYSPTKDTTVGGLGQDKEEEVVAVVDTGGTQERAAAVEVVLSSQLSEDLFLKDAEDDDRKHEDDEAVAVVQAEKGLQKEEQAQTLLQSPTVEDGELLSGSIAVLDKDTSEKDPQEQQICSVAVRIQDTDNHDDEAAAAATKKDIESSPSEVDTQQKLQQQQETSDEFHHLMSELMPSSMFTPF